MDIASTGHTSTHAPHPMQVSSSTTADIGAGIKALFLNVSFLLAEKRGNNRFITQ